MPKRAGFTLVELVIVTAILALVTAVAMPTFSAVRRRARLIACAVQLRDVHQAMMAFVVTNDQRLPPFRFSEPMNWSLPVSGQWGGLSQASSKLALSSWGPGADKTYSVNLWSLVEGEYISAQRLVCPGAPSELRSGEASMFPHTTKFSTYCLRFPYSGDLFSQSPKLAQLTGGLLMEWKTFALILFNRIVIRK